MFFAPVFWRALSFYEATPSAILQNGRLFAVFSNKA